MDIREKMVELVRSAHKKCKAHKTCHECEVYGNGSDCVYMFIADHLIDNGVTVQEWIPVTEPPKDDKEVIIALRWGEVDTGWYDTEDKCWGGEFVNRYDDGDVTHWMPLPTPPKGE